MAAALPIRLNGVIFSGSPSNTASPCAPIGIQEAIKKIGTLITGRDGTRNWMQRATKTGWSIRWEDAPAATKAAIKTIFLLNTTFIYRDEAGVSYTVQCDEDDMTSDVSTIASDGTVYYSITLQIWQA
jgi:hypothetical protein